MRLAQVCENIQPEELRLPAWDFPVFIREDDDTLAGQILLFNADDIGTVGQVAKQMGHNSISIELNPKYVAIAKKRIQETPRCFIRMGEEQSIEPEMLLFAAK